MNRNVEIKARIPELSAIRAKAASLASGSVEAIDQTDTFFVVPKGRLKVRAFADGSGEVISYDRPNRRGPRESIYQRVACQNARALSQALGSVLAVRGVVTKQREVFHVGRTRVHLDQVDGLGCFVELEVVLAPGESLAQGRREAHALLRSLEIPDGALVSEAYIDLVEMAGSEAVLSEHSAPC
jgi:predicted adenylyl cyclase CyaB